jgi:DNA-binding IclR family transcriptional regulator
MADDDFRRIQSLDRALRLLFEIAGSPLPLSGSEAAERVGINRSTAWRLLGTLEQHGLIERDEANRYEVGVGALRLIAETRWGSVARRARPIIEGLATETGESAAVSVLTRGGFEVIDQVDGPHALGVRWVGVTGPLWCTSPGKLILATLSDAELEAVLRGPIHPRTPNTLTDPDDIRVELEEVRSGGVARSIEDYEIGVNGISAAATDVNGRPLAIVTVTGPASRLSVARLVEVESLVKTAAARLANALGLVGESPNDGSELRIGWSSIVESEVAESDS